MIECWPENWQTWRVWVDMDGRWRMLSGLGGSALQGLDLAQAESIMRLRRLDPECQAQVYEGLLVMEDAALAAIYGD